MTRVRRRPHYTRATPAQFTEHAAWAASRAEHQCCATPTSNSKGLVQASHSAHRHIKPIGSERYRAGREPYDCLDAPIAMPDEERIEACCGSIVMGAFQPAFGATWALSPAEVPTLAWSSRRRVLACSCSPMI